MLRAKGQELLESYYRECVIAGITPTSVVMANHWFDLWEAEYNLSLRAPNRKFKVPRWVLEERMVIWWENLIRVRQLCILHHSHDPDAENFDQSPYHRNESGNYAPKSLNREFGLSL